MHTFIPRLCALRSYRPNGWPMVLSVCLLAVSSLTAPAQHRELGFHVGGVTASDRGIDQASGGSIRTEGGLSYEVNYAQRIVDAKLASLHWELNLAGAPSRDLTSSNVLAPRSYSSLFITPGLKLKLLPAVGFSPYGVLGVGYARYGTSSSQINGQPNAGEGSTSRAALEYGGGLDVRVLPYIGVRGEVRDFVTGNPGLNLPLRGSRQHNVLASVGLVLRLP